MRLCKCAESASKFLGDFEGVFQNLRSGAMIEFTFSISKHVPKLRRRSSITWEATGHADNGDGRVSGISSHDAERSRLEKSDLVESGRLGGLLSC